MRRFDDGEMGGAGQMDQLQESLSDLQDLAAKIGSGDVQRDDVAWRLRSYFHVVGVVIDEFRRGPSRDRKTKAAVILLGEIRSLVGDLILELADEDLEDLTQGESFEPRGFADRTPGIPLIIPFSSRRPIDSEDC